MSAALASAVPVAVSASGGNKLRLIPLVALVVGSMVGGGVFNLPHDLSAAAAPGAIVLGWTITGIGMLSLAFVYQGLATRKPALNTGPYAYARAGFGDFIGFNSAWGYWISGWLGNVAYAVAIFSGLSYFFPAFGAGNNVASIIGASIGLWLVHMLVLRGCGTRRSSTSSPPSPSWCRCCCSSSWPSSRSTGTNSHSTSGAPATLPPASTGWAACCIR